MSEVKEKKSKKNKTKKSKLNEVNQENVTTVLPDKEIKNDIIKLEFEPYQFKVGDSQYVCESFGNNTALLNNLTVEFFYNEKLDLIDSNEEQFYSMFYRVSLIRNDNNPQKRVDNYIKNLKKKLREALNIPKVIKGIRTSITYLDGITDINVMRTLPRYLRLQRLESLYERVICMGLSLIHSYYWNDITKNESSIDFNLKAAIERASPYIIKLKQNYEDVVREEFSYDAEDEKLIMSHRKY